MKEILSALIDIDQQGSFCAKQTQPSQNLRITIKDFPSKSGELKFPLSTRAAKSLIKLAKPAKFGWKDQTLLDTNVRDVWEVPKSRVKIDKQIWNKTLNPLLEEFKSQLGLPADSKLKAHLHNLLIYEPGQFFNPHQDSEKLDGMVATLVVVLPSSYRGGTLVIDHQGEKKRFQASRTASDQLTFIAFYADCHHEVKPVTEGYRVTLTYNLVLDNTKRKTLTPTQNTAAAEALAQGLRDHFNPPAVGENEDAKPATEHVTSAAKRPRKWMYLLDYQYTQKSLRWNQLKNEDQVRVDTLKVLAKALDLEAYLVLADIQETWDCEAEYDDWSYGYRRRSYWDRYNDYYEGEGDEDDGDEDEEQISEGENYTLLDLIESDITIKYWIDENNKPADYSGIYIGGDEICWTKSSDEFDPFESEYEGYMGNYGNTLDRWYHRAAIILWRKEDHYAVLCEIDAYKVIAEILQLAKKKATLPDAQEILRGILPYWARHARNKENSRLAGAVFKLALQIQSATLAQPLLMPLRLEVLTPQTAKVLAELENTYGTSWCLDVLQSWGSPGEYRYSRSAIDQFSQIVKTLIEKSKNKCGLIDWLLNYQFQVLKESDDHAQQYSSPVSIDRDGPARTQAITDVLAASFYADNKKIHMEILSYVMNNKVLYSKNCLADILQNVSTIITSANMKFWGYLDLLDSTIDQFEERVKKGNRKKNDWSIERTSACNCEYCGKLNQFLLSRADNVLVWPLRKDRRQHIHQKIDGLGIPVTHNTKREGSPQKLVLTKTDQLFKLDQEGLQNAKNALAKLHKIRAGCKK